MFTGLLMVIALLSIQANAAFRNVTTHLRRKDAGVNSRGWVRVRALGYLRGHPGGNQIPWYPWHLMLWYAWCLFLKPGNSTEREATSTISVET